MTAAAWPGSDDELGPVDFLAIEFPGGRLTAAGVEQLLSLADQGIRAGESPHPEELNIAATTCDEGA